MTYETTLTYSEPLLRKAVFAFWRRTVGVGYSVALLVLAGCLILKVATSSTTWAAGALGAFLALGLFLPLVILIVHYRGTMRKFRALDGAPAMFRADESSFTLSSPEGTSTMRWSVVKEIWRFPDCWLLLYSKAQFNVLPTACLPQELQDFIAHQVTAAGGQVK